MGKEAVNGSISNEDLESLDFTQNGFHQENNTRSTFLVFFYISISISSYWV